MKCNGHGGRRACRTLAWPSAGLALAFLVYVYICEHCLQISEHQCVFSRTRLITTDAVHKYIYELYLEDARNIFESVLRRARSVPYIQIVIVLFFAYGISENGPAMLRKDALN